MEKKPLILVSLCAVVLLVLGSLSNVVGYQSVKSSVNDSLLFQTRTQRATNRQQNILTYQYLGMGKESILQFPTRNNNTDSLQRTLVYIKKMDEATFNTFIVFVIKHMQQNHQITDETSREIRMLLKQIKEDPLFLHQINLQTFDSNARYATEFCQTTQCFTTKSGCIIFFLFTLCLAIYVLITMQIHQFITALLNCPTAQDYIKILYPI
ncbi:hypothetical protein AYK25_00995 [Thermoplasmatales archaeon SM1-50]|nr:MAG: hypothetical protein AYK25_00995 [Thermoplasmatales archaeon SM1-50]